MNTPEEIKAAVAAAGYKDILDLPGLLPQTWDSDYEIVPVGMRAPYGTQYYTGDNCWNNSTQMVIGAGMCVFRRLRQKAWHEL